MQAPKAFSSVFGEQQASKPKRFAIIQEGGHL
jgi:hypothetical protein